MVKKGEFCLSKTCFDITTEQYQKNNDCFSDASYNANRLLAQVIRALWLLKLCGPTYRGKEQKLVDSEKAYLHHLRGNTKG